MSKYDFKVGQQVVIYEIYPRSDGHYQMGTVERVTATQVTVDGRRFMREYPCKLFGQTESNYSDYLKPGMTPEQAEVLNAGWRKQHEIDTKRSKLKRFSWGTHSISDEDVVSVHDHMDSLGLFKDKEKT